MLKTNTGPELPSQGPCKNICNLMAMVKRPSLCTPENWHPPWLWLSSRKPREQCGHGLTELSLLASSARGFAVLTMAFAGRGNALLLTKTPPSQCSVQFVVSRLSSMSVLKYKERGQVSRKQLKERAERKRTWVLAGKFTRPESSLFHAQCTEQHGEDPNCTPP